MTCVWNGNLHGWRVNRSNKHSQKQFLHLDHWIENPKSREHDEHIWFVVRLRIGPVTASLTDWQIYTWRTIATSPSKTRTYAPLDSQSRNNSTFFAFEEACIQKAHTNTSRTHTTYFSPSVWIHQVPLDLFHAHVLDININQETMNLASFSDYIHLTYISKLTSWTLCITGLLHENIQYGMLQSQHYNSGQQTLSHTSSAMP